MKKFREKRDCEDIFTVPDEQAFDQPTLFVMILAGHFCAQRPQDLHFS